MSQGLMRAGATNRTVTTPCLPPTTQLADRAASRFLVAGDPFGIALLGLTSGQTPRRRHPVFVRDRGIPLEGSVSVRCRRSRVDRFAQPGLPGGAGP